VLLPVPIDEAERIVPRTVAMFEGREGSTVVELGSTSMERMVSYLAGLRPVCRVLDPPELKTALLDHLRQALRSNSR
jgi:predicted DNA-binding transcriptional regulator YafY